jgi:hypothetical protein
LCIAGAKQATVATIYEFFFIKGILLCHKVC